MGFESESFSKLKRHIPTGEEDIQRIPNQNAFATLFCQLSRPNLKQHRLPPTSQRSQRRLAAGGHQGCSWETEQGESALPDSDCQDFLLWWATCEMKALCWHFISCLRKILSQWTARSLGDTYNKPDSFSRIWDVNANDISAVANM